MHLIKQIGLGLAAVLCALPASARLPAAPGGAGSVTPRDTLRVTDFGAVPGSGKDATAAVWAAVRACRERKHAVLFFPRGTYDFFRDSATFLRYFESNTWNRAPKACAIVLKGLSGLTVEGDGSAFRFHGRVQPFTVDSCRDIRIRDLSIDWPFPLTAQGRVTDTAPGRVTLRIDEKQYPYTIRDGKLVFAAEGWSGPVTGIIGFEGGTGLVSYRTGDVPGPLGPHGRGYTATKASEGKVVLKGDFSRLPAPGSILVFRHNDRDHAMIFVTGSSGVTLEKINGYHAAGLAVLAQYSEDLFFSQVDLVPNKARGRDFSGHDDGMHFSNCRGQIRVERCRFEGLMDDPINIHGTYVQVIRRLSAQTLRCRFMHPMSTGMTWARPGDRVRFVAAGNLASEGMGRVDAWTPLSETDFEIRFAGKIPDSLARGDALENLSWTPSARISDCYFGGNRARGILVTTPRPVEILRDTFATSGSAILITGDVHSYFESGPVRDVLIRGNVFEGPCNASPYEFTRAVITVYPQIPGIGSATPPYHRHIKITGNTFESFNYPVLFASSVDGLAFTGNVLMRSFLYPPYGSDRHTFTLVACRHVRITGNTIGKDVLGKDISETAMDPGELRSQPGLSVTKKTD